MKVFNQIIKTGNYEVELYQEENSVPRIQIRKNNKVTFLPTISPKYPNRTTIDYFSEFDFEIQTTSYGALEDDEFETFLKAQNDAFASLREIKTKLAEFTPEYVELKMETF